MIAFALQPAYFALLDEACTLEVRCKKDSPDSPAVSLAAALATKSLIMRSQGDAAQVSESPACLRRSSDVYSLFINNASLCASQPVTQSLDKNAGAESCFGVVCGS